MPEPINDPALAIFDQLIAWGIPEPLARDAAFRCLSRDANDLANFEAETLNAIQSSVGTYTDDQIVRAFAYSNATGTIQCYIDETLTLVFHRAKNRVKELRALLTTVAAEKISKEYSAVELYGADVTFDFAVTVGGLFDQALASLDAKAHLKTEEDARTKKERLKNAIISIVVSFVTALATAYATILVQGKNQPPGRTGITSNGNIHGP